MHSRTRASRGVSRLAVLAASVLATVLLASSTALAASGPVETNAMTFGLLGPVGIIAVALGVVGMVAGVLRQRRKTRELPVEETAQLAATPNVQSAQPPSGSAAAGIRSN